VPPDDARTTAQVEREAGGSRVDGDGPLAGIPDPHDRGPAASERYPRRRRGQAHGLARAAPGCGGHERQGEQQAEERPSHRPMTVKVTVAV
jgi:hypothetical protein